MAIVGDIEIDGFRTRRKLRGHNSLTERRPCWEVFEYTMLILQACVAGRLDGHRRNMETLNIEFPDHRGILALADETNRREEWPTYRAIIESMVRAGILPEFFNPKMPWTAVIAIEAADNRFWEKRFTNLCERNVRAEDAATASARARSGHLPAMQNDGLRDMQSGINAGGLFGPYEGRLEMRSSAYVAPQMQWPKAQPRRGGRRRWSEGMSHDTRTREVLAEFRGMGVRLAVDDFGTGYSALSYLREFPVSTLKIDRSFICDITQSQSHRGLVEAIIAMAHGLDLKTIAEGVETAEQGKLLAELNCDMVQGFFYCKAVSANEIKKLFSDRPHVVAVRS